MVENAESSGSEEDADPAKTAKCTGLLSTSSVRHPNEMHEALAVRCVNTSQKVVDTVPESPFWCSSSPWKAFTVETSRFEALAIELLEWNVYFSAVQILFLIHFSLISFSIVKQTCLEKKKLKLTMHCWSMWPIWKDFPQTLKVKVGVGKSVEPGTNGIITGIL